MAEIFPLQKWSIPYSNLMFLGSGKPGADLGDLARLGFSIASIWSAEQRAGYMDANSIQE